jgi:plastocyanin
VLSLLAAPSAAQTTHTVSVSGITFGPANLTIQMGDTVDWVWGSGSHNVESGVGGAADGNFASGAPVSGAGTTFSHTFDAAFLNDNAMPNGVYDYYCIVHLGLGMTGTVTVQAPLVADSTALSIAAGGTHKLALDAGPAHAGMLCWIFGSATGTAVSFPGPPPLPLTFDSYLLFTFENPNTLMANSLSFLDGVGQNIAAITIPPATISPTLAGVTLWHAYLVLDGALNGVFASNATHFTLFP